jgi:hypothetical protein
MANQSTQKPTASELEILRVLWDRGPSTVREVHEALSAKKPVGYTSVLKLMQIMTAKGTVRRNEEQRPPKRPTASSPPTSCSESSTAPPASCSCTRLPGARLRAKNSTKFAGS